MLERFGNRRDRLLGLFAGVLLELLWAPGRHHLEPLVAVREIDGQILTVPTLVGGIPDEPTDQLVAGDHMGHDVGGGPAFAQGRSRPAIGRHGVDRL